MDLFNDLSLRTKITAIIVSTVLFILGIGFSIDLYSETELIKERMLAEKTLTAKIIGNYTVADLTFHYKEAAQESISYLKKDSSILNAHLYDANNKHFVSLYGINNNHLPDFSPDISSYQFNNGELHVVEPIMLNGERVGTLCIHTSTSDYLHNLEDRVKYLTALLITLIVLSIIIAGKLSNFVTSPILSLARAARNLSQGKSLKLTLDKEHKDETGELVRAFNDMFQQITFRENERDLATKQLKENEENLKLILNNIIDGIITTDEAGTILTVNKAAETLFGYSAEELTGQSIKLLIPNAFNNNKNTNLQHFINAKIPDFIGASREIEALRKNKTTFTMRLSVSELPSDANNRRRFIGSCQDLTLLKQQEEQLRRTQKMDALGKLTGGIAHDYNNMLGVITGYAELLEEELDKDPELAKYAQAIQQAGRRGAKLTRKLLSFSKQGSTEPEELNLNTLIREEQHMLEKTLTVRIKLVLDLDDDLWPVCLDSSDVIDVILNMSINAMHAIDNTGQLTICTNNETLDALGAQLLNITPGDYVALCITDTGSGMEKSIIDKIFDPFFSTKGSMGTGLGLSQVYGFVKHNNGAINVYSEPRHGTSFVLYFPRFQSGKHSQETYDELVSNQDLKGSETILIVDDEPALVELSKELLSQQGYHILTAQNGKQALEVLEKEDVDLLLSDVIMPEMDGYELAAIVQEKYPAIKIQLASGFTDNRHIDRVDAYLHENLLYKPFNSHDLLQKIRSVLE